MYIRFSDKRQPCNYDIAGCSHLRRPKIDQVIPTAKEIIARLKAAGVPQSVIAKKLAIPQSAVSNLFNDRRELKLHEANTLLAMLPREKPALSLPRIGMAGAGRWLEAIEEARETVEIPPGVGVNGRFVVDVSGDSMNLILPEGSMAIIDPDDKRLFSGRIFLLRNGEGEATIKRYRADPARFEPVSDNPEHVPFEIGETDFSVIGRVTGAVQKF